MKPDLAAPSAVSSAIYDPDPFTGTSSAAPHVAGAAALLRGQFPLATADELQTFLDEEAADLGAAGSDNLFGAGVLLLPASPPLVTTSSTAGSTTNSLTVSGLVSPRGIATTYSWEYGTTTSYGSQTAAVRPRLSPSRPGGHVDAERADSGNRVSLPADRNQHLRDIGRRRPDEQHISSARAGRDHVRARDRGPAQARLAARVGRTGPHRPPGSSGERRRSTEARRRFRAQVSSTRSGSQPRSPAWFRPPSTTIGWLRRTRSARRRGRRPSRRRARPACGGDRLAAAPGTTAMTLSGASRPGSADDLPVRVPAGRFDGLADDGAGRPGGCRLRRLGARRHGDDGDLIQSFAYEYRLVATNALGSHVGDFRSVTIAPPAAPAPPPPWWRRGRSTSA